MGTKRPLGDEFRFSQGRSESATAALAGRELPSDLVQQVSSISVGQLFYILGHIQKLSAQAPVTAQALLAENPQICHALLHAECLAGMVEEPMLPMTADELRRAKAKARQMQDDLAEHELPQPVGHSQLQVPASSSSGSVPFSKQIASLPPAALQGSPVGAGAQSLPSPTAGGPAADEHKGHLMQKLLQLTPEQISRLPQNTKVQLLQFLQQHQQR
mmetsp:Transcript_23795/g.38155  ORF Transcript_23795/g.38155 Transcript_23795/m.38155 type:complete len:216 (+) Transcript_23795:128-775(+)